LHSTTIIIKPAIIVSFDIFLQSLLDSWDFKTFGNNVKFPQMGKEEMHEVF
jgi:hypothetical protein